MSNDNEEFTDALTYQAWVACGYQPVREVNDRLYELQRQLDEKREAMARVFETLPLDVAMHNRAAEVAAGCMCFHLPAGCHYGSCKFLAASIEANAQRDEADRYYAEMVERMRERAPA